MTIFSFTALNILICSVSEVPPAPDVCLSSKGVPGDPGGQKCEADHLEPEFVCGCELPCGYWALNLGAFQEQCIHLEATEPFFFPAPLNIFLIFLKKPLTIPTSGSCKVSVFPRLLNFELGS